MSHISGICLLVHDMYIDWRVCVCMCVFVQYEEWNRFGRLADVVRYHIVSCEMLNLNDLKTTKLVVSTSGHTLHFSLEQVTHTHTHKHTHTCTLFKVKKQGMTE